MFLIYGSAFCFRLLFPAFVIRVIDTVHIAVFRRIVVFAAVDPDRYRNGYRDYRYDLRRPEHISDHQAVSTHAFDEESPEGVIN